MCEILRSGWCTYADGAGEEAGVHGCEDCPLSEPEKEKELFTIRDNDGMREGEKVIDIETIIKAYKFCKNNEGTCDKCSYFPKKSKLFGCPINEDMISAISEQKAEIDRLKAEQPKWIPVDEQLPDDYEKVLIYDKKWGILPGWHSKNYWDTSEVKNVTEITHWMPKPTPPKAGEQE